MKLYISSDLNSYRPGYQTVSNFENFRWIAGRLNEVEEIRVLSFLLGLSCINWLVDNKRVYLNNIRFVFDGKAQECAVFKDILKKYRKEGRR